MPKGFPPQHPVDDFTLSVVSSKTRITFAGTMLSLNLEIGLAVLFSYDYFILFHQCLQQIIDNNISFSDRDALISALEEGGIGTLIHPNFGSQNVVSIGYSLTDNINDLGISKFTLNFEVASVFRCPRQVASSVHPSVGC